MAWAGTLPMKENCLRIGNCCTYSFQRDIQQHSGRQERNTMTRLNRKWDKDMDYEFSKILVIEVKNDDNDWDTIEQEILL